MKLRRLSTQRSESPPPIQNTTTNNNQPPKSITPFLRTNIRSTTLSQSLQTIDIDLTKAINSNNSNAKVSAIIEMEQRLKQRASEFISKIRKDKIHRMGRAVMRKQQEEQNRQIKWQAQRCSQIIKEEEELLKRRRRANDKVKIFQAKQKERRLKSIEVRRYKTIDELPSPKRDRFASENHIKPKPRLFAAKQADSYQLKNSIYLDQQQRKIEQTRRMLIRLSTVIEGVQKIKQKS